MPETENNGNGENSWREWRKLVFYQLEHTQKEIAEVNKSLTEMRQDIISLKVKSGVWGAIAGLIPAALAIIYMLLTGDVSAQ